MESKTSLKSFSCKVHPSESVQRVLRSQDADNSLRCVECILENIDNVPKNAFISLNDFIEEAVRHYASSNRSQTLEGPVPNELIELLSSEENNIEKLKQYIDQEKTKVIDVFDSLQQKFTQLCQSKKEDLCKQLDLQVETLKLNYRYYESTIHRHFNQDSQEEGDFDKDTFIHKINECENTNELEVMVKRIKDDLRAASTFINRNEAKNILRESLQNLADELQTITETRPKTSFMQPNYHEELLKNFSELINPFIESCSEVTSKIEELNFNQSLSINSHCLRQSDLDLLKKWIDPSRSVLPRMRLLYRASRNGFSLKNFHDHCDNHENTLVIVKSEDGKIYGGFSDQLWNNLRDMSPRQSKKSWVFSLSEKTQYLTPQDQVMIISGSFGAGFCFGNQSDFSIIFSSDLGLDTHENLSLMDPLNPSLQRKAFALFNPFGYKDPAKSSQNPQDELLSLMMRSQSGLPPASLSLHALSQTQSSLASSFMQSPTSLLKALQPSQNPQILNMQRIQIQMSEQQRILKSDPKLQAEMSKFSFTQTPMLYFPIKEIEVFQIISLNQ